MITLAYTLVSNVNIFNLFDILSVEWIFRPSEWTFLPWPSCFNFWLFHAINCLGLLRITWLLIEINLDSFWAKKCHDNYRYFWSKKLRDKFWKKISNGEDFAIVSEKNTRCQVIFTRWKQTCQLCPCTACVGWENFLCIFSMGFNVWLWFEIWILKQEIWQMSYILKF